MSGINFFSWIRDGVRQSVMLGVSDAIEQLGTPAAAEELHPSVAGFLNAERSAATSQPMLSAAGSDKSRKRLGRSLKEIDSESQR